jgi:NAD(P)-dependent dehydrogenase (short-subunit alcohol dehydrogenase family)
MAGDRTPLAGRRALVTGSSRNLGAEIAQQLAAAGAQVAVTSRQSPDQARRLVAAMTAATGGDHVAVSADLGTPEGVAAVVTGASERFGGPIDILVNNAGPFSMTPFVDMSQSEWDAVWDTNVKAAWLTTKLVAPDMRASGWGRVVNIAAGSAYIRNHSIYGLAKDAVMTLTEELALELGPAATVNAIAPGQIAESAPDVAAVDPTFVDRAVARTPAGRLVTRSEVAALVVALCGPEFEMVTGATIPVDGGWRLNRF